MNRKLKLNTIPIFTIHNKIITKDNNNEEHGFHIEEYDQMWKLRTTSTPGDTLYHQTSQGQVHQVLLEYQLKKCNLNYV